METGTIEDTAKAANMTPTEVVRILRTSKDKLWQYRSHIRPKPHRDEKVYILFNTLCFIISLFLISVYVDFNFLERFNDYGFSSCLRSTSG